MADEIQNEEKFADKPEDGKEKSTAHLAQSG